MDTVGALRAALLADGTVVVDAIYGDELPLEEVDSMPAKVVVIRSAGGGTFGGREKTWSDGRFDVDVYATSMKEAGDVYATVRKSLAQIDRKKVTVDGIPILVHWAHETMRGIVGREPDTQWPTCIGSWQVMTAEV